MHVWFAKERRFVSLWDCDINTDEICIIHIDSGGKRLTMNYSCGLAVPFLAFQTQA